SVDVMLTMSPSGGQRGQRMRPGPTLSRRAGPPGLSASRTRSLRGDRDGPVDDLLLVLVQLLLDVVDVTAGRGVADTVGLQVVDLRARLDVAGLDALEEVVHRDVDVLRHRGQDAVADRLVGRLGLVG